MEKTTMTNAKALTYVLENCKELPDEIVEKLNKMLEQVQKKSGAKKPTATQTANEVFRQVIVDYLIENSGEKYTITELLKNIPELADLTNQRVSALIRPLIDEKIVVRVKEKRVSYFHIVTKEDDTNAEAETEE